ncbi:MAG TPA: hypothetical protein VEW93_00055 [Acidimicrobiales bacterium]|nr:hypothetical protein [Acidimicrobiales bacterium]
MDNGGEASDLTPASPDDALARAVGAAIGGRGEDGGRPTAGQVREVMSLARASARRAGRKAVTSGRWLAEVTLDATGHLPVRDLATLQAHHDGLAGALLARPLVRNASLAAAAVGATTGALAAASEATPATWAALPVELAAETLIVVALEMKLVGELHEAAGYPLAGDLRANGPLIAKAWAETRGLSAGEMARLLRPGQGGALASSASDLLGRSARDQLTAQIRRRLLRRAGRNMATFVPLMAGALAGGELNRRATRKLGLTVARTLGIPPP